MTSEKARQIAEEVASGFDADLEVVAAIPTRGGSSYVELLVLDKGSSPEPCRLLVGASRTPSEATFRRGLLKQLQHAKQKRAR